MGGAQPGGITHTTGNTRLDTAIVAEVRKIVRIIPVNPTFKFYDDSSSPNAMAYSPVIQLPAQPISGTWGLVIIGLSLLQNEFSTPLGGVALAGIIAHECAHIWQFQAPALNLDLQGPTARFQELHADYMAGFYFGREGVRSEQTVEIFGRSLFQKGSYNFNDANFHGTPDQRVSAMTIGYQKGRGIDDVGQISYDGIQIVKNL